VCVCVCVKELLFVPFCKQTVVQTMAHAGGSKEATRVMFPAGLNPG
jgi:hypothetical protein